MIVFKDFSNRLIFILLAAAVILTSIIVYLTVRANELETEKTKQVEQAQLEASLPNDKNINRGSFVSYQGDVLTLKVGGSAHEFTIDKNLDYLSCMPKPYMEVANNPDKKVNLIDAFIDIGNITLDFTMTIFKEEIMIGTEDIKDKVLKDSGVLYIPKSISRAGKPGLIQKFIFLNCNP